MAAKRTEYQGRTFRNKNAKKHRERVEPTKPRYGNHGEAEVVPAYQLSKVLNDWIVLYMTTQFDAKAAKLPPNRVGDLFNESGVMGPTQVIAARAGMSVRRVSDFTNRTEGVVWLSIAEKLLIAIDKDYLLTTGEIQIVPNPSWSMEKWVEYMRARGCA